MIEYGPGTGVFTHEIADAMRAGQRIRYLGIERDPGMRHYLSKRFEDLEFVCDDVLNVESIHAERDLGPAKAIICSVPLIFMKEPELRQVLISSRSCLRHDGVFRTISYLHSYPSRGARRLRREMRDTFADFGIQSPVWQNFPPALVLTACLRPEQVPISAHQHRAQRHIVTEPSDSPGTI